MEAKQVRAQRKYAQAVSSTAHIPPSNPSTPLERRVETGAQNSYKVFYNNNDAENLLFSYLHHHTQPIVLVKRLENTTMNAKREPPLHRASKPIENGARSHAKCETEKPPEFSSSVSPPSKTKSGIKLIKKPSPVLKKTVIFKKKIDAKAKIVTTKPPVCPPTDDEQPLTEKKKPVPLTLINRRKSFRRKSNDSGNRWLVSVWTATPHKQPPLDLTELESQVTHVQYVHPYHSEQYQEVRLTEAPSSISRQPLTASQEFLELHKRESDI